MCGCFSPARMTGADPAHRADGEGEPEHGFEEAARIRDQIQAVRRVTEKQFVSNTGDDLDVIGVAFDAGMACVHVLFIRQGKVLGSRSYFRKCRAAPSWERSWRPLSASSTCRAAKCARCRGDFARL